MPTGYTAAVVDGSVTEFKDFALSCARAFGALVTMRDEPMDAAIPYEFKPCSYNEERLGEASRRLADLANMTDEEISAASALALLEAMNAHDRYEAQCTLEERRIEAMEVKVAGWKPPTAEHADMKNFMLQQLAVSKRGSFRSQAPERLSAKDWHLAETIKAAKDIEYHAGEHAKEIERARSRTQWVAQLRASL